MEEFLIAQVVRRLPGIVRSQVKKELAVYFKRRVYTLEKEARAAERATGEEALKIVRALSSGIYTRAALRRMGHPYSTRRASPPQDAAIINLQSGKFRDGWKLRAPRKTANGLSTSLVNNTPYAAWLFRGTRRMIPRPILLRLREKLAPIRRRLWKKHVIEALTER